MKKILLALSVLLLFGGFGNAQVLTLNSPEALTVPTATKLDRMDADNNWMDADMCRPNAEPVEVARLLLGGKAGSGCLGGTTHYIGDTSENATQFTMTENILYCFYVQANCTGTLGYAHVYHDSTNPDNIKVAVYGDIVDPSAEPDGESMIGNAVTLSHTEREWAVSAAKVTGSVVSGTNYWLCHVTDATGWVSKRDTTGGDSESVASSYTTPSNPMPSSGWSSNTYAYSMYVEIE